MAKANKKTRIRKSAPAAKEKVVPVEIEKKSPKPPKLSPLAKLHLKDNKLVRLLRKILSILIPRYFINAWREVRQVIWPTRKETWRLTLAVFTFAIIFGTAVAIVDKGLDEFFKRVILK